MQRPARQARERNEEAVRQWVSERWPAVKKKPGVKRLGCLPGRERHLRAALGPPHLGAARPDASPDPCLQLEPDLGGGGPGLPLGWEAMPPVLPDPPGQLRRGKPDRLPEGVATPLSEQRVILVWDGLPAHKSRIMKEYLDSQRHWLSEKGCRAMRRISTRWRRCGETSKGKNWRTGARKTWERRPQPSARASRGFVSRSNSRLPFSTTPVFLFDPVVTVLCEIQ